MQRPSGGVLCCDALWSAGSAWTSCLRLPATARLACPPLRQRPRWCCQLSLRCCSPAAAAAAASPLTQRALCEWMDEQAGEGVCIPFPPKVPCPPNNRGPTGHRLALAAWWPSAQPIRPGYKACKTRIWPSQMHTFWGHAVIKTTPGLLKHGAACTKAQLQHAHRSCGSVQHEDCTKPSPMKAPQCADQSQTSSFSASLY